MLLADNIFERSIRPHVDAFQKQGCGARVLLTKVGDPERFGIAALDEEHVIEIEEKPSVPKSNHAVVGCYMYDSHVFDYIRQCRPSPRGELEITDVNSVYIRRGELQYGLVDGRWTDAGTFESLNEANGILLENRNEILT